MRQFLLILGHLLAQYRGVYPSDLAKHERLEHPLKAKQSGPSFSVICSKRRICSALSGSPIMGSRLRAKKTRLTAWAKP